MPPLRRRTTAGFGAGTVLGVLGAAAYTGAGLTGPGPISLATTLFALVWVQRRYPLGALGLAVSSIVALRLAHLTDTGWLWPATLLYVQAALTRRTAAVVALAAGHAVWAFDLDWTVLGHPVREAGVAVGIDALWLSAAIAVTVSYRTWRRLQAESLRRLRVELDERRTAERLRLAQEVHDAVAHTLAVVGVHVNVAADALDTDPAEARAALRLAQEVRRRAMADLSALVGVLRAPEGDGSAVPARDGAGGGGPAAGRDSPGFAPPAAPPALEDLVAGVRATGLDPRLVVTGDAHAVALPARLVAAAVVREALTNVVKHARAGHVTVTVHYGPVVEVGVCDDGAGRAPVVRGHGLRGLAERVTALGGEFSAGPEAGGFAVRARIPA